MTPHSDQTPLPTSPLKKGGGSRWGDKAATRLFQFLILIYQKTLSPFMGNQCRFTPTCSCYMHEALEKHGTLKGLYLGILRIVKCNPWIKSKWVDPVPETFAWAQVFRYKTGKSNIKN